MLFGERIRELRRVHQLTQRELAQAAEVSVQYFGRIEQGRVSPSFAVIERICAALGVEPFNLFFFDKPLLSSDNTSLSDFFKTSFGTSRLMHWGPRPSFIGTIFLLKAPQQQVWSGSVYRMLGYASEHAPSTANRFLRHILPSSRSEVESFLENARKKSHTASLIFYFLRKDISFNDNDDMLLDDLTHVRPRIGLLHVEPGEVPVDGNVIVPLTIIDVTEWKYLELALVDNTLELEESISQRNEQLAIALEQCQVEIKTRESLESDLRRFEWVLSLSHDALAFIDREYRYRIVNDGYVRLFEKTREQIVGQHVSEILGSDLFENFSRPLLERAFGGEQVSFCRWMQFPGHDDGRNLVLVSYAPFWSDRIVTGILVTVHDLTKIVLLQEKLRNQENQYQLIVETANEGIWVMNEDGRLTFVNPQCAAMLGRTRNEMEGRFLTEFIHPEDLHVVEHHLNRQHSGMRTRYNVRQLHSDGSGVWTQISVTPLKDGSGKISGFLAMVSDISRIKQAETELRESRKRYRTLVENAQCIILQMDVQGRIVFINEFGLQFFGYTAEELVGRSVLATITPRKDLAGRDLVAMIEELCQNPERFSTVENENVRRDGSRVWVGWYNQGIYDGHGQLVEILSIGHDVTQRQQQEVDHRIISEIVARGPVAAFVWRNDLHRSVEAVSENVAQLFGWPREVLLSGNVHYFEILHPDDRDRVWSELGHLASCKDVAQARLAPYRIITPNDRIVWVEEMTTFIRSRDGKVIKFEGLVNDVSISKLRDDYLVQSNQQLEMVLYQCRKMVDMAQKISPTGSAVAMLMSSVSSMLHQFHGEMQQLDWDDGIVKLNSKDVEQE
ncbi:PAS domain S-box protein [Desulfonatronum parangueonense]